MSGKLAFRLGVFAAFAALLILSVPSVAAQERKGAFLDEITFIHFLDEQIAVKEVQAGNLDAYFWPVPLEIADQLKKDPNLQVYESPGGMLSLLLNPSPTPAGKLNPFSIKEVRYAINFLVDREFIVNEILRGFGAPQKAVYGLYDPDYLVVADQVEGLNFKFNPELASKIINDALTKAGAVKVNGKWTFKDEPVKIKFFIRSDDPRRNSLGEALAAQLEKIGFTVDRIFGDLIKAFDVVYGSDPQGLDWQIYTEGWGRSAFVRYDTVTVAQMYAPWYGNMPGFGQASYFNYKNEDLDRLTQRVATGNFTSKAERDNLIKFATNLGIGESVRIFLVQQIQPYVVAKSVKGVVNDFGAGITTRYTLYNARFDGSPGGNLRIGMKQILQGAWNPVGGFRDAFSQMIVNGLADSDALTNPFTGDIIPFRATWNVETAGPSGKLPVPKDAIVWDPVAKNWKEVGDSVRATSKVTYNLKLSNWHHGMPMNKADFLYGIYFSFDWGTKTGDDDPTFDSEFTNQVEPLIKTIRGVRFLSDDKAEVYFDFWHFDPGFIAQYFTPGSSTPWELFAAMEKVVLDKKAAFSRSESKAKNVEWLSLIIKNDAELIKQALVDFKSTNAVPKPLQGIVSPQDAVKRYDAAIQWIDTFGHSMVSNGPYQLVSYNPDARTIKIRATGDPTYPFPVGTWSGFEKSKVAEVQRVSTPGIVQAGTSAEFEVEITIANQPSSDATVAYLIANPDGKIVAKGNATATSPGRFNIKLPSDTTSTFTPGSYTLRVLAVGKEAIKPAVVETSFPVSQASTTPAAPTPTSSPSPTSPPTTQEPSPTRTITSPAPTQTTTPATASTGFDSGFIVPIVIVVVIIAIVAGIAVWRRKKQPQK